MSDRIDRLEAELLATYRQAAAERLRADDGWNRYEAANKKAIAAEAQLAAVDPVAITPTENQIDDMIFGYAPSCNIGEGRELVGAILAAAGVKS